ncbi:amidohydrolase [Chryseobacterium sp. R2A-55]|uniref:amidohydrolase n=1 Tax=Chryseobacterium sp. R2A-55 TaxID=2744445 RepID=UPI001F185ACC|nr:amidohydrolase [Chryseobacterium sp. R2A-55]
MKKTNQSLILLVLMAMIFFSCTTKKEAQIADHVFTNGKIYTVNDSSPWAEAVAVKANKIIFVGTAQEAKSYIGKTTEVTDLGGKMLMPGFVESHIHPTVAWVTEGADLQTDDKKEMFQRLIKWADENPQSPVVRGFGWRYSIFPKEGPDKKTLDSLFPDKPVFLIAIDGHGAWVNSKVFEMTGVDKNTPDPMPGFSTYQRYPETGEPTGFLVEIPAFIGILGKLIPTDLNAVKQGMETYMQKFSEAGITTAFDAGILGIAQHEGYDLYQQLEKEGKLSLRIFGSYYYNKPDEDPFAPFLELNSKYQSELVKASILKINVDGGDAQYTAAMLHPYAGKKDFKGELLMKKERLNEIVKEANDKGIPTFAHIIGDAGVRAYLDAVEYARKKNPEAKTRHTASHIVFMDNADIPRFKQLNVSGQMSAQWATPDPSILVMSADRLGLDFIKANYMKMGSLVRSGANVGLGTDWFAAGYYSTYKPLEAIYVAMTRSMVQGKGLMDQLLPVSEVITLEQALHASTMGSAYILNMEKQIGSIEKGKLADFVVLDKNLFEIPVTEIKNTQVLLTVMNGKVQHQKEL